MRRLLAAAAVTAVAATLSVTPAAASGGGSLETVVGDLDGPRGVAVTTHGNVVFGVLDGTVSRVDVASGRVTDLGKVPAGIVAPAVAADQHDRVYALTTGGEPGAEPPPGGATLFRLRQGTATVVADIAAYQRTDPDPFNLADPPTESNPFGVETLPDGSVLVADAANNDLLRVFPSGKIVTVARLKPRTVTVPAALPDEFMGQPLPPAGTRVPAEAVATSVTVGADGYYYVGELRGFPATPGTSEVWRIKPGSVGAICDPAHPQQGSCRRYADGFTSIVDLGAGRDGSIYVVELVRRSWLQWELELVPGTGSLFRIAPGGGGTTELVRGKLTLPGGVDVGPGDKVYVTSPVFGTGAVYRVHP